MKESKWVRETILQHPGDKGPFYFGNSYEEGSLDKVIQSLLAIRKPLPVNQRSIATCEIRSGDEFDDPTFEVSYYRLETLEELAERLRREQEASQREQARRAKEETKERALYKKLKEKYGP